MCAIAPLFTSYSSMVEVVAPIKREECSSMPNKIVSLAEWVEFDFGVG